MTKSLLRRVEVAAASLLPEATGLVTLPVFNRLASLLVERETASGDRIAEIDAEIAAMPVQADDADPAFSERKQAELRLVAETMALFEGVDTEQAGLVDARADLVGESPLAPLPHPLVPPTDGANASVTSHPPRRLA